MSITDVDDKIILRSRYSRPETRLLNELESPERSKAETDSLTVGKEGPTRFYNPAALVARDFVRDLWCGSREGIQQYSR